MVYQLTIVVRNICRNAVVVIKRGDQKTDKCLVYDGTSVRQPNLNEK